MQFYDLTGNCLLYSQAGYSLNLCSQTRSEIYDHAVWGQIHDMQESEMSYTPQTHTHSSHHQKVYLPH